MWLVQILHGPLKDREQRTFACPVCDLPSALNKLGQPN
jgi:hypothetical protein